MLTWLLAILFLLTAFLAIPVTLRFRVHWPNASQDDVQLRWFFGAVRVRFSTLGDSAARAGRRGPAGARRKKERGSQRSLNIASLVRNGEFRQRVFRFMGDCWRALQKKELRLNARIGLDDPADTGQLWALVGPWQGLLAGLSNSRIDIQPDFAVETFELSSQGTLRLVPLTLVYHLTAVLVSPAVWRGLARARSEA